MFASSKYWLKRNNIMKIAHCAIADISINNSSIGLYRHFKSKCEKTLEFECEVQVEKSVPKVTVQHKLKIWIFLSTP